MKKNRKEMNGYCNEENYGKSLPVEAPNEPHLACALLLDTSSSMSGDKIYQLNKGLNDFLVRTSLDETAQKRVDIAVVEFNSATGIVQEFTPLSKAKPVELTAGGCTAMGAGIMTALDLVHDRCHEYDNIGAPRYKPWVFMITDGMPTDDISAAAERIRDEEKRGRLKFWSLGVDGYDAGTLHSLSERCMALSDTDFSGIFNWLSESMAVVSASHPADNPELGLLPENARVVPKNW